MDKKSKDKLINHLLADVLSSYEKAIEAGENEEWVKYRLRKAIFRQIDRFADRY